MLLAAYSFFYKYIYIYRWFYLFCIQCAKPPLSIWHCDCKLMRIESQNFSKWSHKHLSLWCLAAQMLSDKAKAHPCFETCPLSPCDWMNLRAFVLFFFVFSGRKFRSFGCICPHCSNFFFKVLDIGTVFRCAEIFFMLEALSVVFIFFNNPIRNRMLILVWISHNLIANLKHYLKLFPVLVGQQLLL